MKSVHSKHWQWNKSVLLANVLHLCSESDVISRVKNRQRQVLIRTVILCECTYGRKKFKEGGGWGAGATELSALAHAGLRCFSLAEHHSEVARLADGFGVGRWLMGGGGVCHFSALTALCRSGGFGMGCPLACGTAIWMQRKNATAITPPSTKNEGSDI